MAVYLRTGTKDADKQSYPESMMIHNGRTMAPILTSTFDRVEDYLFGDVLQLMQQDFRTEEELLAERVPGAMPASEIFPPEIGPTQSSFYVNTARMEEEFKDTKPLLQTGSSFSLDPFSLVIRAVKVPLLGYLDIAVTKAKAGARLWFSWVYRGLGYADSFVRIQQLGIKEVTADWRSKQIGAKASVLNCDLCNRNHACTRPFMLNLATCCPCSPATAWPRAIPRTILDDELVSIDGSVVDASLNTPCDGALEVWLTSLAPSLRLKPEEVTCTHTTRDFDPTGYPDPSPDGLGITPANRVWRSDLLHDGYRCTICYPKTVHSIHDKIDRQLLSANPMQITNKIWIERVLCTIKVFKRLVAHMKDTQPELKTIYLTASSVSRPVGKRHLSDDQAIIVISESPMENLAKVLKGRVVNFVVPKLPSERYLACWRPLLAVCVTTEVDILVCNAKQAMYETINEVTVLNLAEDLVNFSVGHVWAGFMGAFLFRGGTVRMFDPMRVIPSFLAYGYIYGWDESVFSRMLKTVVIVSHTLVAPGILAPLVNDMLVGPNFIAKVITPDAGAPVRYYDMQLTRLKLYYLAKYHEVAPTFSKLDFLAVLGDTRPIVVAGKLNDADGPEVEPYDLPLVVEWGDAAPKSLATERGSAPGDNVLADLTYELGGIIICTFGTTGDIRPLLAIARWLRRRGAMCYVQNLVTEAEGHLLLRVARGVHNSADEQRDAVELYSRAQRFIRDQKGLVWAPAQLHTHHFSYSLAPPADVLRGFVPTTSSLLNIAYRIMSFFSNDPIHIGAYKRPGWLPRSADGSEFLAATRNSGEVPILAAWGSDGEPDPRYKAIPVIEPGDHISQMSKASVVVCHGGAGTVQTAASCGARVISTGYNLDRAYSDPFDAGRGVEPGAAPDRILLALASQDVRFLAIWLRQNIFRPWELISWYGLSPLGNFLFRLLMLFIVYNRTQAETIVSTDPLTTLVLVLSRRRPTFYFYLGAFLLGKGLDKALDVYDISYLSVIRGFINLNLGMAESMVGMFLSQRYNLAMGLCWAWVGPKLTRGCELILGALSSWASRPKIIGETYDLEFSFVTGHGVPVFHTALVGFGKRYEGYDQPGGLYTFKLRPGARRPKSFVVPTQITEELLATFQHSLGIYGPTWNCQTGLLINGRFALSHFGPALLPLIFTASLASVISCIVYGCAMVALLTTSLFPGVAVSNDPRIRLTEHLLGALTIRVTRSLVADKIISPITILDWTRSLMMPFAAPQLDYDSITSIVESFRNLPVLYQLDKEVQRQARMRIRQLVLANEGVLEAAIFEDLITSVEEVDETVKVEIDAQRLRLRSSLLNDETAIAYMQGADNISFSDVTGRFDDWAPEKEIRDAMAALMGGDLVTSPSISDVKLKAKIYEIWDLVNAWINENASNPDMPQLLVGWLQSQQGQHTINARQFGVLIALEGKLNPGSDYPRLPFDEREYQLLRAGVSVHLLGQQDNRAYHDWYVAVANFIERVKGTRFYATYHTVFRRPPTPTEIVEELVKDDFVVTVAGEISAALTSLEVPWHIVEHVEQLLAVSMLKKVDQEKETLEVGVRKWLWNLYLERGLDMATVPEMVGSWLVSVRKFCEQWQVPFGVLNSLVNLFTTIGLTIYQILDKFIETIVGVLVASGDSAQGALTEYFYLGRAFLSLLLPEARRRPKAVWALLFANDFTRLTPSQKFLLSCQVMNEPPEDINYQEWATFVIGELERTGLADEPLALLDPVRKVNFPQKATTVLPQAVREQIDLFPEDVAIPPDYAKFVEKWVEMGVPQGVTGMWFATADRVASSIQRYDVERPDVSAAIEANMDRTVDAMVEHYPHLYKDAVYLTPAQTIRNLANNKMKYASGLPFMPQYRTRAELRNHGYLLAIQEVAKRRLETGITPGTMAHSFVKDQVVDLDKLLREHPKNIRTVVAQDLIGNVIKWTATLATTRRPPKEEDYVMNSVKHTEGGFRVAYEAIRARQHVIQADATEFDSKLHPVISVRGLTRLRSKGFEGQPGEEIVRSQLKSHYLAMRHCKIRDLMYGREFGHTGGLMTGQADTAPDNKDSFRLMIISAWAFVTGRDPSLFWDSNTLINAGDDDVIGTDDPRELWDEILEWITKNYGVVMNIEVEGFENVSLTALSVIGVPSSSIRYYNNIGIPVPDYAIAFDPMRVLHRKTEFKMNEARKIDISFYMNHVQSLIGSAWLTAHQPGLYEELAKAYTSHLSHVLLRFFEKFTVHESRNEEGDLIAIHVTPHVVRRRYQGKGVEERILKWLRTVKFPTYARLMEVWLKPNDLAQSKVTKTHNKILSWIPSIPWLDRITFGLLSIREGLYHYIPNHVAKPVTIKGEEVTYIMRNTDYVVAKFVWKSLVASHGKMPTPTLFRTALRESPYGSAEDPIGFLQWLSQGNNLEHLVAQDLEVYRGQMFSITLIYYFIETIFKAMHNVPGLGWLVHLFALSTRDINRLYAALNFVYMLSTGRSSVIISNMMPNDPYAWIKQFAVITSCLVPSKYHYWPGLKHVVALVPRVVELWAAAGVTVRPNVFQRLVQMIPPPDEWLRIAAEIRQRYDQGSRDHLVLAPTASGKSTAFVGALQRVCRIYHTLWVLCPTRISAQEYTNNFVQSNLTQILELGVVNNFECTIKVCTYGHFLKRYEANEVEATDLLLFDEFHLMAVDMVATWFMTSGMARVALTATHRPNMPDFNDNVSRYQGARRFNIEIIPTKADFASLWQHLASVNPDCLRRALIICPTLTDVENKRNMLNQLSVINSELSAEQPNPVPVGAIVATTVVDVALTIDPPPTVVIDCGKMLEITLSPELAIFPRYNVNIVTASPSVATQRAGRAGRLAKGLVYQLDNSGKGEEIDQRPSPASLLAYPGVDVQVLATFGVKNVMTVLNEASRTLLRFAAPSEGAQVAHMRESNVAVALYIWFHLSSGMRLEEVRSVWENHRLSLYFESIQTIIASEIDELGAGSPLTGNFDDAIDLLESGVIEIEIEGVRYPSTCLVTRAQGIILPPQLDPHQFLDTRMVRTLEPRFGYFLKPSLITRQQWYQRVVESTQLADNPRGIPGEIVPFVFRNPYDGQSETHGSLLAMRLYGLVQELIRAPAIYPVVWQWRFEGDRQLPGTRSAVVALRPYLPGPNELVLDLSQLNLPSMSEVELACLLTAFLPDNYTGLIGHLDLRHHIARYQFPFQLTLLSVETMYHAILLKSSQARAWYGSLYHAVKHGQGYDFITTRPGAILIRQGEPLPPDLSRLRPFMLDTDRSIQYI